MELIKIAVDDNEYTFVNETESTRSGFCHKSTLFNQYGSAIGNNRVNYYNRTWESYRYQTVMRGVVSGLIENRESVLKNDFKAVKGIKSLNNKYKAEYNAIVASDKKIILYKALLEKINNR